MFKTENIGEFNIAVTPEHKFGTDAFLLAHFADVHKGDKVCDLGTGCGIIPLLWLRGQYKPSVAYGVEISSLAKEQLWQTIAENNLEGKFYPINMDLKLLGGVLEKASFDVVACNPPYKAPGTGIVNPESAKRIARHETECTIYDVCKTAASLLRFGGKLVVCQRPERLPDILEAMRANKIEPKRLRFIQKRPDTQPWLFLCEGRRGGKPFLQVDPPLFMQDEKGEVSAEVERIYGK